VKFKGLEEEFINRLPWEWFVTLRFDYPFYRQEALQCFYNWCSDLEITEKLEIAYMAAFKYKDRKPCIHLVMLGQKKKYIKRDRTLLHANSNKWKGYWLDHSAYNLGIWFLKEYQEGWRPKWEKWRKDKRHLAKIELVFSDEPVSHLVKNMNPSNPNNELLVRNVELLRKIDSHMLAKDKILDHFLPDTEQCPKSE
jgi:hypothetical protein